MKKYFIKPKNRISENLLEFDVTRLTGWGTVGFFPYVIIAALLLIGVTENIEKLQKWSIWPERIVWLLLLLIPSVVFLMYFLARKRSTVLDFADKFPRYHTLDYYRPIVMSAGVLSVVMCVLPFILGKETKANDGLYVALVLFLIVTTVFFWLVCSQSKTEVPSEIESGRRCSWTPEEEEALEAQLKNEVQQLDKRIEKLLENRGNHPCRSCNGQGVIGKREEHIGINDPRKEEEKKKSKSPSPPVIQEDVCEVCAGTGKLEWINDAQRNVYEDTRKRRDTCVAELRKLDDSGDWKQMSLNFRFPWFTEHGHPEGDEVPDILFQASADGIQRFKSKNETLFIEWQSLLEDANASDTYTDKIGQWGKAYVSQRTHSSESREVKTLSYHLYQTVRNNSLSELQQVELFLAAAQSLTKSREEVPAPELNVHVKPEGAAADLPKKERFLAVVAAFWDAIGFWRDPMSKVEENALWEKIKKWQTKLQKVDDDDLDVEIEDTLDYVGSLDEWNRESKPDSEWPGGDYKEVLCENLSPREHAELISDLDQLNDINIEKNTEKYNQKTIRISDLKKEFDQIANIYGSRKTFKLNSYPKFPTETLIDQQGTIDDTSILLAALLHDCGFKVRLYRSSYTDPEKGEVDCMGVAVGIEGSNDPRLIESSRVHKGMVYCEPAVERWYCNDMDISDRRVMSIDIDAPKVKEPIRYEF